MQNKRKTTKLPFLLAAMTLAMTACEKTNTTVEPNFAVSNIEFSDCLQHQDSRGAKGMYNPDSISINYHNGTVYITHYNLTVNCGFKRVYVDIDVYSDTIRILESGYPVNADCMCDIDNSFEINNVPSGLYTVIIENWDSNPYCQTYRFQ